MLGYIDDMWEDGVSCDPLSDNTLVSKGRKRRSDDNIAIENGRITAGSGGYE